MLVGEFHADVNIVNKENLSTPLHGAAFGGHADVVAFLVLSGANTSKRNAYHETPLDNAKAPAEGVKPSDAKKTVDALADVPASSLASKAAVPDPIALSASTTAEQLNKLAVADLRQLLSSRSMATTGVKATLVARLLASVAPVPIPIAAGGGEEPPTKKLIVESSGAPTPVAATHVAPLAPDVAPHTAVAALPAPVVPASTADPTSVETPASSRTDDPKWIAKLSAATYTETEVVPNTQEFWDLEEKVNAWYQGRNEDYVSNRLKKKKKPLTFVLKRAWKINNPVLEEAFAETRKAMQSTLEDAMCRVRVAFHGTRDANISSILQRGLLRFKHPLNPCKTQADDGYFGTNLKGVYVSRYYDYTLKYCNGLNPLDDGDLAKTIMFKCLPGKVFPIPKLSMGIQPTPGGYHSHSSPNNLEWYLFDECQCCPEYVIEMKAQVDTRTAADDE